MEPIHVFFVFTGTIGLVLAVGFAVAMVVSVYRHDPAAVAHAPADTEWTRTLEILTREPLATKRPHAATAPAVKTSLPVVANFNPSPAAASNRAVTIRIDSPSCCERGCRTGTSRIGTSLRMGSRTTPDQNAVRADRPSWRRSGAKQVGEQLVPSASDRIQAKRCACRKDGRWIKIPSTCLPNPRATWGASG